MPFGLSCASPEAIGGESEAWGVRGNSGASYLFGVVFSWSRVSSGRVTVLVLRVVLCAISSCMFALLPSSSVRIFVVFLLSLSIWDS